MNSFVMAAVVAAGLAGDPTPPDPGVTPAGYWPGGGTAWSGTTSYYGFGREVPYGYGFGSEAYGPRLRPDPYRERYESRVHPAGPTYPGTYPAPPAPSRVRRPWRR